ncbi:MAG: hypothetical protein ABSE73_21855 [Planctomycetota bacterium]
MSGTAGVRKEPSNSWPAILITIAPLLLLVNCWDATFLPYDDAEHIFSKLRRLGFGSLFLLPEHYTYFPLTILSYRLDRVLFVPWMDDLLGTWAPGVRLMTCVYHAGAALCVWQIVRLLGLSRGKALFVAFVFAVHPTACETVCWASERKNALAGMFGFASLWVFLRFEGCKLQAPLSVLFYLLALLSKPSVLGLLPVLLLAELCGGVRGLAQGEAPPWRVPRYWAGACWRFLPFLLLSGGAVIMNLHGHAETLVPPPGGTVFTAMLTDAEVLSRYLYNIFVPVELSFSYFVAPITSVFEPRFLGYATLLASLFAASVWLAPNRRLALFGWLWFLLALLPNLNFIAIPSLMQDRYIYLSLPGILTVAAECVGGLIQRARLDCRLAAAAGIPFFIALAALGIMRGGLFGNMYLLFNDAAQKQPLAADAHHGLAYAYAQVCEGDKIQGRWAEMDEARHNLGREFQCIVDRCPDGTRQFFYLDAAFQAGKYSLVLNQPAEAERYLRLVLNPPPWFPAPNKLVVQVLALLSTLKLQAGQADEAYALAGQALALQAASGEALLARAAAALALATTRDERRNQELRREAENDLALVPQSSPKYGEAQEALKAFRNEANRPTPQEPSAQHRP